MRLWHKDLISVLPRQQLLSQWRECCCIAKNIAENGTPNHLLVNKIMNYPMSHFLRYTELIQIEMEHRGYKCDLAKFMQYFEIFATESDLMIIVAKDKLFKDWHNHRYLRQCTFNLEEKYDCGGISKEEWIPIYNKFHYKNN